MSKDFFICADENLSDEEFFELEKNCSFYCPGWSIRKYSPATDDASIAPVLIYGDSACALALEADGEIKSYTICPTPSYRDLLSWNELATDISDDFKITDELTQAEQRLRRRMSELRQAVPSELCYLFGPGSVLSKAASLDWSKGLRISSANLALDPILWNSLSPHFLVLDSPVLHFGPGELASRMRSKIAECCKKTQTQVVYDIRYHALMKREFGLEEDLCIPLRLGVGGEVSFTAEVLCSRDPIVASHVDLLFAFGAFLGKRLQVWGFGELAEEDAADPLVFSDLGFDIEQVHYRKNQDPAFELRLEQYLASIERKAVSIEVFTPKGLAPFEKRAVLPGHARTPRRSRGRKRIAFLLALERNFVHERFWYDYLKGHEDYYSLYLYSTRGRPEFSHGLAKNAAPLDFFKDYVLPLDFSKRSANLLGLQRDLLEAAYPNRENYKFVILMSNVVPVRPFEEVYESLTNGEQSFFSYGTSPQVPQWVGQAAQLQKNHFMLSTVDVVLNRKHAGVVLDDHEIFNAVIASNGMPIGYYASVLNQHGSLGEVASLRTVLHGLPKTDGNFKIGPGDFTQSDLDFLDSESGRKLLFLGDFEAACDMSLLRQMAGLKA